MNRLLCFLFGHFPVRRKFRVVNRDVRTDPWCERCDRFLVK